MRGMQTEKKNGIQPDGEKDLTREAGRAGSGRAGSGRANQLTLYKKHHKIKAF